VRRTLPASLLLLAVCAASLVAQGSTPLSIRAARRDSIVAATTVTATFTVSNARDVNVQVMPHIEVPKDWTVLTGQSPFLVSDHGAEIMVLSVAVPARAAAGAYALRAWVTSAQDPNGVMDSVVVIVPRRQAIELGLVDRPGFVVAGKSYDAGFLLRNRGNVPAVIRISSRSSMGVSTLSDTLVALGAEQSKQIRARVLTRRAVEAATDDVLELTARADTSSETGAEASARVTVVPEPDRKIEEFLRIPTEVRLRAASTDAVSPFEVLGAGRVWDGSATQMNFLFRGPTGAYSAFGERDEYRVTLTAPSWRVRGGDHVFMLSPLTGVGQPGMGAGADASFGMFRAGGHVQSFRRLPEKGSETGAFISAAPISDARVTLNVVDRVKGFSAGRVGSVAAEIQRAHIGGDIELARSAAPAGGAAGNARTARVNGMVASTAYELGHLFADTSFTGTQRGSQHDYVTVNSQATDQMSLALNASTHRTDLTRSTGTPYIERFDMGTLGATFNDRITGEVGAVTRATTVAGLRSVGQQRSLRARADQDVPFATLTLEVETGRARDAAVGNAIRAYHDVSLAARRRLWRGQAALWADSYSGGSITKGQDGTVTIGGDASTRVGASTDLILMGYATRVRGLLPQWHSQLDGQIVHTLPNGNTISLRARLIGGGNLRAADQSVAYLEYGLPLRLPVSRLRTPGRVYGRVVDAVTGRGVPGALVRLGPQAAITDAKGQVAFGGVPGGEHRVSMSQETSFADAVFVGDPTLRVDSTRAQPTTFELAIARSARLDIVVRRFASARTAVGGVSDSLVDAGALANATLMLTGDRDTLYRTTNDKGSVSFTDVPPGHWVVTVRGDAPAFTRFDPDRLELSLAPGETRALVFRLVPRKREVQIIGDGQELRPTTLEAKPGPAASPVKTGKPNDRPRR